MKISCQHPIPPRPVELKTSDNNIKYLPQLLRELPNFDSLCILERNFGNDRDVLILEDDIEYLTEMIEDNGSKRINLKINPTINLDFLAEIETITDLQISYRIGEILPRLVSMKNLTILNLEWTGIDPKFIPCLGLLENLVTLNLSSNNLEDTGAKVVAEHVKCQTLNLTSNKITDVGAGYLAGNRYVVNLILYDNKITSVGAGYLFRNGVIRGLHLEGNKIEKADGFVGRTTVSVLRLGKIKLGENEVYNLLRNTEVKMLDIAETEGVTDQIIEDGLKDNTCLEDVVSHVRRSSLVDVLFKRNKRTNTLQESGFPTDPAAYQWGHWGYIDYRNMRI